MDELLEAAKHAVEVSEQLMALMNQACEANVAPGPKWGEALDRLKADIAAVQ